jgi:hypothetical protein
MLAPPFIRNGSKKVRQLELILKKCYSAIALMSSMVGGGEAFFYRSGFKTSDQVQGQGVRPAGKAQHTWVCEHLPEACNAAIGPQMGF